MTWFDDDRRMSRRSLLKAAGVSLALPWLDAMEPFSGRLPAVARRVAFVFQPNGMHMPDWTPSTTGPLDVLPPILEPLGDLKSKVTVHSGLDCENAYALGDGPGDHARETAVWLTGVHPKKTSGADIRAGVSVDQVIASRLGEGLPFRSLELGCDGYRSAGDCDSGYACAYVGAISWRTERQPNLKETSPRAVFRRVFGEAEGPEAEARRRRMASVLDVVRDDAKALSRALGARDKEKIDEYLTSVRELEQRVAHVEARSSTPPDGFAPKDLAPDDYPERIALMYDLLWAAFVADRTRVATFMPNNGGSNRAYATIEVPDGHHDLSHHGRDPSKQAKVSKINRFHMEAFAKFLKKLRDSKEGDTSLLDASCIVYGSGIRDGDQHDHRDVPTLVAGTLGGLVTPAGHVRHPKRTPLCNLHLALIDRVGPRVATFGDARGRLAL